MKFLLILLLGFGFLIPAQAQQDREPNKVTFEWSVEGGNYFSGKIAGKYPITMFIDFQAEAIPMNKGSVYARAQVIRGWYYYDKVKTKLPLVGILEGDEQFKMYVPTGTHESKDLHIYMNDPSDFYIYNINQPNTKLPISETFTFNQKSVTWTYKGKTSPVTGIDIQSRKIDEFMGLVITESDGNRHEVNMQRFMEKEAYLSMEALQGLNGWAETTVQTTYTHTSLGTNILLHFSQSGSCNTDRYFLVPVEINKSFKVLSQKYLKTSGCRGYFSHEEAGEYRIISSDFHDNYGEHPDYSDKSFDIGAYKLKEDKVIVLKPWDN